MTAPDFSSYTEAQLRQARSRIDATKYPERVQEIEALLAAGIAATGDPAPTRAGPTTLAGYWRRMGALFVDMLILGVIGYIAGIALYAQFAALGAWGRALGFLVALAYFGTMESGNGGGASLGKRLFGLQVVARNGKCLNQPAALGRSAIFCLAYFLNGASISFMAGNPWATLAQSFVIVGLIITVYYLLAFNRRTRQSVHDLAVGAFVVKAGSAVFVPPAQPVWRGHFVIIGLLLIGVLGAGKLLIKQSTIAALTDTHRAISALPGLHGVNVIENAAWTPQAAIHSLAISAVIDDAHADAEAVATRLAQVASATYAEARSEQLIVVTLSSGYDIGIASHWRSNTYAHTPAQWRALAANKGA